MLALALCLPMVQNLSTKVGFSADYGKQGCGLAEWVFWGERTCGRQGRVTLGRGGVAQGAGVGLPAVRYILSPRIGALMPDMKLQNRR